MRTLGNSGSVGDVIEDRFGRDISAFRPRGHIVRMIAVMRMAVRVAVSVRVAMPRVIAVIEVMMHLRRGNSCLLELFLKTPLNRERYVKRILQVGVQV